MYKKIFFIYIFIIIFSCSAPKENIKVKKVTENYDPKYLYNRALDEFDKRKFENSLLILKKIEEDFSYSTFHPKVILMRSYIYYEINDYIKSLESLKKFKKFYPTSKYISYADFLTAMCLLEQINPISKDQTPANLSLKQFKYISTNYPTSRYAEESRIYIEVIEEHLAGHEMYLARLYIKKEKWIPAILRLNIILEKYSKTVYIQEALHRLVEINYKLGNLDAAKKYASILGYNYNETDWYKKSYKIVGDKNYVEITKKRKKNISDKFFSFFNLSKDD